MDLLKLLKVLLSLTSITYIVLHVNRRSCLKYNETYIFLALDEVEVNIDAGDDEPDEDSEQAFLKTFKIKLKTCLMQRFENDKSKGQKVQGRNIVTTDIFNDKFYILATILDPRCKTIPFEGQYLSAF